MAGGTLQHKEWSNRSGREVVESTDSPFCLPSPGMGIFLAILMDQESVGSSGYSGCLGLVVLKSSSTRWEYVHGLGLSNRHSPLSSTLKLPAMVHYNLKRMVSSFGGLFKGASTITEFAWWKGSKGGGEQLY